VRALAAGLAFASAAVSLFWLVGGTALLDTVGGDIERLARERSAGALAVLAVVVVLKVLAGLLALHLDRPWRVRLARAGAILLALYGGVLVVAGALVLTGVIDPSGDVDRRALHWHVLVWDLWFVVWGVALALATRRPRR
jgi:hypothetical protein